MVVDLIQTVKEAGVVGAGGAGFPTWIKLQSRPDTLIVNGAECEPLLRVDQLLMARYAKELCFALDCLVKDRGAKRGIFALKEKYREACTALRLALKNYARLEMVLLPDIYPAGDEHVLVYHVLRKPIPPGQLPISVGAVVVNVETLYNIFLALKWQPVTHKFVTIAGAVRKPCTVYVPLGIPVSELLQHAGGSTVSNSVLIDGGPCMGTLTTPEAPVTKTTKGILVFPEEHCCVRSRQKVKNFVKAAMALCCNCRTCTDLCPRHLLGHPIRPHRAVQAIAYQLNDTAAVVQEAWLCSECGVCDLAACSFGISPREIHRSIKRELQKADVRPTWEAAEKGVDPMLEWRQMPTKKIIRGLDIKQYDHAAPWQEVKVNTGIIHLPLKQSAGRPAVPVVIPGQMVAAGGLVARAGEGVGSCLHTPVNGTVIKVDPEIVIERQGGADVWNSPLA